jgi:hypothetical protein
MHIDSKPRNHAINSDKEKINDDAIKTNGPSVTPSSEKPFSPAHLPGSKQAVAGSEKPSEQNTTIQPAKEKSFEQKQFSERLARAEEKARIALDSEKNKMYQTQLGILSPEAEKAVNDYNALFQAKSSNPGTRSAVRSAFDENFISPDEEQRWQALQSKLPIETQIHTVTRPLGVTGKKELAQAIFRESGFSLFEGKPEGNRFIEELMSVVNQKAATMTPTDKGMALVFRFPGTYGEVGHIAVGSLWRNEAGQLRMDVSHQESVAPTAQSGNVYTGRIFDTFDTAKTYPTKIAPVVEGMKLFGPPSVNVFPVPFPEVLAPYTQLFKDHEVSYGATEDWAPAEKSTLPKNMHKETCFNVTHKTLARMFGMTTTHAPLLPTVFKQMKGFAGVPEGKFKEFEIKGKILVDASDEKLEVSGVEAKKLSLEQAAADKSLAVLAFMNIGPNWIDSGPADLNGKMRVQPALLKFKLGQVGFQLEGQVKAFKFASEAPALKDLRLDGKPVIKGKVYTAEEAQRMTYLGKEPSKEIKYVVGVPLTSNAKL